MNRRDFMGTVVGGIAVAKLGAAGLYGYGAETAAKPSGIRRRWSRAARGVDQRWTDRCGRLDHEPYIFVVRRGGQSLDAREIYEYEQSEEVIRTAQEPGG